MPIRKTPKRTLKSRILRHILQEVKRSKTGRHSSDYYAKQANPKDGGYAKDNYVKGDGFKRVPATPRGRLRVDIKIRPSKHRPHHVRGPKHPRKK